MKNERTTERTADFGLLIVFVEYGYEAHFFRDGKVVEIQCRDLGGSYPVPDIVNHLHETLSELLPKIAEPKHNDS